VKRKIKTEKKSHGIANQSPPTIFEQLMDLKSELHATCGLKPVPFWKRPDKTPEWTKNICAKFKNTIFKSVLKLKPKRNKVNCQHYGRSIGCLDRFRTFLTKDIPRELKKDGLNKISKKRWAKIKARLGLKQMRQYCLKALNLPANDKTSDKKLCMLLLGQQLAHHEKIKQTALLHVASQDAKTTALFWKGVSEGYTLFLNVEGEFSGDDRRFEVFADLIGMQYEVEKMRRMIPEKSRNDLRAELKKSPDFQDRGQKWFNDVCDEIKLSMKGAGRSYKFALP
jgi:hypothetical protein